MEEKAEAALHAQIVVCIYRKHAAGIAAAKREMDAAAAQVVALKKAMRDECFVAEAVRFHKYAFEFQVADFGHGVALAALEDRAACDDVDQA